MNRQQQTNNLLKAIARGNINTVIQLLDNGQVDPNGSLHNFNKLNVYSTPLMAACLSSSPNSAHIVKYLLKMPNIDINKKGPRQNTALSWAAAYSRIQIINQLLFVGTDINVTNDDGNTPLMMAAAQGNALTVLTLLNNNACRDIRNNYNKSALDIANKRLLHYNEDQINKIMNVKAIKLLLTKYKN